MRAIETLRKIEAEGRPATPSEQKILAQYTGWGAMPGAFNKYGEDSNIRDLGGADGTEVGEHGPIFRGFYHDAAGAVRKLSELKTGEAIAALHHPDVGDIDLIWGETGYGLAKIAQRHP